MKKVSIDSVDYYAKVIAMEERLADKGEIKLHLLILYKEIDRLKERLNVFEKKFEKSSDE